MLNNNSKVIITTDQKIIVVNSIDEAIKKIQEQFDKDKKKKIQ